MLFNPTLQPWFEYDSAISRAPAPVTDPLTALPPIQPCYGGSIGGHAVNCSVVCDYSYLLFDPQHLSNVVTCGLWASVSTFLVQGGQIPTSTPFDAVGLNISGIDDTGTGDGSLSIYDAPLQDLFVNCFAAFYAAAHSLTNNITSTPNTCSATAIFQRPGQVEPCFMDLCAPRTLDPDLGGTGVFASLIIQSSIAIVTSIILLVLVTWPTLTSHRGKNLLQAMMMATVDFEIAQCYSAGAMQIAALVYTKQDFLLIRWIASPELLDAGLLFTIATNGFVPTVLTLSVTMRYGRQSWYLILLCSIVFVLSTGTLAASSNAWYAAGFDPRYAVLDVCGDFLASDLATAWCGSNNLFSLSGYNPTTINKAIWVMWAHSLLWLVYCFSKKIRTSDRLLAGSSKLGTLCQPRFQLSARLPIGALGSQLSKALFFLTWSLSLSYQLWLYAIILHGSITNHTWSFGQILPIVIWAPCLVEFMNLQINGVFKGSEYKFPPPLALATLDSAGSLRHDDDSTSRVIPLADMGTRRAEVEDENGLETASREMQPEERI